MHNKYPHLLSPLKVGNVILKNRMICPPSKPHFIQGNEDFPSENLIRHYADRARNGAAVVTCDGAHKAKMDPLGGSMDWCATDPGAQHYTSQLADAIHFYGSRAHGVIMAMPPAGFDVSGGVPGITIVGTGAAPAALKQELPNERVYEIIEELAQLAKANCDGGMDGVYIHMSYRMVLPGRFLSPLTNRRTDEFGGSFENRIRFPLLLCKRIKELCGKDFLIDASVSGHDPLDQKGWTLEDTVGFAKAAEGLIDIMTIRAPEIDPQHPTGFCLQRTPWLYMAEAIKKADPNVAIAASAGFFYPEDCEAAVAGGQADLLSMARAFVSNPDYGKLVYTGRGEDVVPCLRCNKCHVATAGVNNLSVCVVNPRWANERRVDSLIVPPEGPKKVAVIGGGPAGMEAALVCAGRGRNVTIYEKTDELGGLIKHAKYADFKWPMLDLLHYLDRKVRENPNINLRLGQAPTPEEVAGENYDVVLAAVGSTSLRPPIPGIEKALPAVEAFEREAELSRDVVIIGGGEIGTETGLFLARKGHRVTVVEMLDRIAAESYRVHYYSMFMEAVDKEKSLTCITSARCTGITDSGITYVDAEGAAHSIEAGTVLVAAGMKANVDARLAYSGCGKVFYSIGDCLQIGNLQKAIKSAYAIANTF